MSLQQNTLVKGDAHLDLMAAIVRFPDDIPVLYRCCGAIMALALRNADTQKILGEVRSSARLRDACPHALRLQLAPVLWRGESAPRTPHTSHTYASTRAWCGTSHSTSPGPDVLRPLPRAPARASCRPALRTC